MSLDLSGGEETDAGEAKILVVHKHFDWNDVGLTEVIDKTTYVSVTPGINAVSVTILETEEVVIIHGGDEQKMDKRPRGQRAQKFPSQVNISNLIIASFQVPGPQVHKMKKI